MSKYPGRIVTDLAPAGYSVFFDGTGDFLTYTPSTSNAFGTGDFTVECFIFTSYAPTGADGQYFYDARTASVTGTWAFGTRLNASGSGNLVGWFNGSTVVEGTALTLNVWNHCAYVRSGTSYGLFLNGVRIANGTDSTNYSSTGATATIGNRYTGSGYTLNGYMSNLRIVKGTAVYSPSSTTINVPTQLFNITNTSLLTCSSPAIIDQSSNAYAISSFGNVAPSTFTPFTAYVPYNPALGASTPGVWTLDEALQAAGTRQWNMYDPSFNSTTLLLHGNPTNGTAWLTDVSTNNFALTTNGDAKPANLSPFSLTTYGTSGSGYFDGTGDYLSNTSAALISNAVSTFTVECWLYLTANPPANGNDISAMCTLDGQPTGPTNFMSFGPKDNRRLYLFWFDGSVKSAVGGTVLALNTWYHIVCVVNSNAIQFYVNGVAETMTGTTTLTNRSGSQGNFAIGSSSAGQITGYISNFRVTTTAVYTGAFTTPTAPLTAISGTRILTLQNSQSANNNAFLDSSSNNFLITRNGNTTQGSFTPFSQAPGYWGNYFDGNAYLSIPSTSNLAFGTGDFCVEFWFYQAGAAAKGIFSNSSGAGGGDTQFEIQINVSSKIVLLGWNSIFLTGATTINAGSWYHIAVLRSGTSMAMFVNGVRDATATSANNFSSTNSFVIGMQATGSGGGYITGYISNLRAVKGASVYNPSNLNITVPTVPLGATSGGQTPPTGTQTSLLTCQSSRFVDNGGLVTPNTITVNGTPSVQAFSPFYPTAAYTPQTIGGSGYFDGTGDYLITANNAAFNFGSGNFCIETWFYPTTASQSTRALITLGSIATGAGAWLLWLNPSAFPAFYVTTGGTTATRTDLADNKIPPVNSWTHIVVCRTSNTLSLFVNGSRVASTAYSSTVFNDTTNSLSFMVPSDIGTPTVGYLSGSRIIKGASPYDATLTSLTVPAAPATNIANTSILLNYANAGVVDSTGDNVLETAGDARISTAVSRFGGSSMFFDGTGDAFVSPNSLNFSFGTGDFTIEAWIYPTARGVYPMICKCAVNGTWATGWALCFGYLATEDKLQFWINGSTILQSTNAVPLNTWSHVAVSRSGTSLQMFVNGVQQASATNSTAISPTSVFTVGADIVTTNYNYFGYIDDLRITKVARYTGNFTPQTSQWQDQ